MATLGRQLGPGGRPWRRFRAFLGCSDFGWPLALLQVRAGLERRGAQTACLRLSPARSACSPPLGSWNDPPRCELTADRVDENGSPVAIPCLHYRRRRRYRKRATFSSWFPSAARSFGRSSPRSPAASAPASLPTTRPDHNTFSIGPYRLVIDLAAARAKPPEGPGRAWAGRGRLLLVPAYLVGTRPSHAAVEVSQAPAAVY